MGKKFQPAGDNPQLRSSTEPNSLTCPNTARVSRSRGTEGLRVTSPLLVINVNNSQKARDVVSRPPCAGDRIQVVAEMNEEELKKSGLYCAE